MKLLALLLSLAAPLAPAVCNANLSWWLEAADDAPDCHRPVSDRAPDEPIQSDASLCCPACDGYLSSATELPAPLFATTPLAAAAGEWLLGESAQVARPWSGPPDKATPPYARENAPLLT